MWQRERIGNTGIDWRKHAFGKGKYRRKTIGFGAYDKKQKAHEFEIWIREASILDAGLGCAVWDAAIIMSRWIYTHGTLFVGQNVLELGAGVGLPGIVATLFSDQVVITDYIQPTIDNLQYNVDCNAGTFMADSDSESEGEGEGESGAVGDGGGDTDPYRRHPSCSCVVPFRPIALGAPWSAPRTDAGTSGSATPPGGSGASGTAAEPVEGSTQGSELAPAAPQACHSCAKRRVRYFRQRVAAVSETLQLDWDKADAEERVTEPADIILGSELTYSTLNITARFGTLPQYVRQSGLAKTLQKYLKPDGVFYELLSDDRDGVKEFLGLIKEYGFLHHAVPVGSMYLGRYGTGQRDESYTFHTFYRSGCRHPMMQ